MFKGHPKGLYVLFFTEMWERFGYYTVMAIFVYFLGANFGWSEKEVTNVYGYFLAFVYITPLLGGWIADNLLGYGKTIILGAITMMIGYGMMAVPTDTPIQVYIALGIVVIGNGLFKANISVLVGNLYAHTESSLKDAGYNIFYMGINVGAFFAPFAASAIKNFFMDNFQVTEAIGYNAGFGVASFGMLVSLLIFVIFRKYYIDADYQSKNVQNTEKDLVLTPKQEKDRIIALVIIFVIVIFFWLAFHQNGAALSLFAKSYTSLEVSKWTYLLFDLPALLAVLGLILTTVLMLTPKTTGKNRGISAAVFVAALAVIWWRMSGYEDLNIIDPEKFQAFNPMFIVFLTPLIVGFFAWLNKKGKEPSSPKKIGIGMLITGLAYVVMIIAAHKLPAVHSLGGAVSSSLVSPYWLIGTFFTLTLAELFISPMGLSFVSKVAPPKLKGLMMGGWFGATAVGNYFAGFVGRYYQNWELWQFFLLLVGLCLISVVMVLFALKKLENATK
jgi:POT family proton-dependent oligopeptide transporter